MMLILNDSEALHVTGHRPKDLGGYDPTEPMNAWLIETTAEILIKLRDNEGFRKFFTGMALGFDQWSLEAALRVGGFHTIAAVPCAGQEKMWPDSSKKRYFELLEMCDEVHVLADSYSVKVMHQRNEWMVDRTVLTLAAFTEKESGGTYNCLKYASKQENRIIRINPILRSVIGW
jgi:uncharacterized phage-like protein YoqJ